MNEPTAKCEFCGSEKGKIEPQANETEQELENAVSPYTNFKCHACSVCDQCRRKAKMKSFSIMFAVGAVSLILYFILLASLGLSSLILLIFGIIGLIGAPVALAFAFQDGALLIMRKQKEQDKPEKAEEPSAKLNKKKAPAYGKEHDEKIISILDTVLNQEWEQGRYSNSSSDSVHKGNY